MGIAVKSSQPQPWRKEIKEYQSVETGTLVKQEALKLASDFIQRLPPETSSELMRTLASFKDDRSGIFHKSKEVQGQRLIAVKKLVRDAYLKISQNPPLNYGSRDVIRAIYSLIRNDISPFNLLKLGKKKITDGFNGLLFQVELAAAGGTVKYSPFILQHATLAAKFSQKLLSNLKKDPPDPQLLTVLALNLSKVVTQNIGAESLILKAVYEQKFGSDREILKIVASSLTSFRLTDPNAQFWLSWAIFEQKFGDDPETLKIVASSLISLKFTSIPAQSWLSKAIYYQKFGIDSETLKIVASSLISLNFTYHDAQHRLIKAIQKKKFGADSEVMATVAKFLLQFSIRSTLSQDTILAMVLTARGALGHPLSIIANWALSEARYNKLKRKILDWTDKNSKQAEIQEFSGMGLRLTQHIQFGEFKNLAQVATLKIAVYKVNLPIPEEADCSYCISGHGSYGITYNEAGYIQFLIMYRDESQDTLPQIAEQFNGFLDSDPEFSVLYQSNFAKLRVYDLTNLQGGYPTLVDSLSSGHLSFPAFPGWLQQAIIAQEFNPADYVNSSIIKFVLSLVDDLPFAAEVLGQQCKAIVQAIIKNQGEAVKLASEPYEDAKIKDLIEEKMAAIDYSPSNSCHAKTREFVATLDNCTDKLKLGFLFGQIAKSGALGYHFSQSDSNNRANSLFAHLAIECFKQAIAEHPKELGPKHIIHKVLVRIQNGVCIEAETNRLAWKVPALSSVWQKKSAL